MTLRAGLRQRHRQFESFYVQRYWALMDRLSLDALKGEFESPSRPSMEDEKVIRSYFLLCEDECDLRAAGWISDATWNVWRTGMASHLVQWPFNEVWERVEKEPRPFQHLRRIKKGALDVRKRSKWNRVSFGLLDRPGV